MVGLRGPRQHDAGPSDCRYARSGGQPPRRHDPAVRSSRTSVKASRCSSTSSQTPGARKGLVDTVLRTAARSGAPGRRAALRFLGAVRKKISRSRAARPASRRWWWGARAASRRAARLPASTLLITLKVARSTSRVRARHHTRLLVLRDDVRRATETTNSWPPRRQAPDE